MVTSAVRTEIIGDATLYLGDCRDVLPGLPPVDMVGTDPPYGIGAADWDTEVPLWALPKIRDALIDGGACYWFGMAPGVWSVGQSAELTFQRELVWWHGTGFPSKKNYRLATETVMFMTKGGSPRYFDADAIREEYAPRPERPAGRPDRQNHLGKSPGNVLRFPRPAPRHIDETDHPHAKPVELLRTFVLASCPPNGVVLDPFMGSGATGVAAIGEGRRFVGIEMQEKYFAIACRRIEAVTRQHSLAI